MNDIYFVSIFFGFGCVFLSKNKFQQSFHISNRFPCISLSFLYARFISSAINWFVFDLLTNAMFIQHFSLNYTKNQNHWEYFIERIAIQIANQDVMIVCVCVLSSHTDIFAHDCLLLLLSYWERIFAEIAHIFWFLIHLISCQFYDYKSWFT